MLKRAKSRKLLSRMLAMICVLSLLLSSFAFFTDRENQSASATAGNIDLVFTDISSSATGENGITSPNEFAVDKTWTKAALVEDGKIINPGDYFDLSYELTNTGSKSIDVRQQLIVTSTVPMSGSSSGAGDTLTWDGDTTGLVSDTGATPTAFKVSDATFTAADFVGATVTMLDGSQETTFATDYFWEAADGLVLFEGGAVVSKAGVSYDGTSFPETGTYFMLGDGFHTVSLTLPGFTGFGGGSGGAEAAEYTLTITGGNNAQAVTGQLSNDKKSITYDLADIIINGSVEEETGAVSGKYIVRLDFDLDASNAFMGSSVTVSMDIQAKQHRNTGIGDWADWTSYKTKFEQINGDGSGSGSGTDSPIKFGEVYSAAANGMIATMVFQEDGSAVISYYQNGSLLGSDPAPAGTLSYGPTEILMEGQPFATVSADGKTVDATASFGVVFTLGDLVNVKPLVKFEQAYTAEIQGQHAAFVFYEDGRVEMYSNGVLSESFPVGSAAYAYDSINISGQVTLPVSADGNTIDATSVFGAVFTLDPDYVICKHENKSTIDASENTCEEEGYTGDVYCNDCQRTLSTGDTIPASGHSFTGEYVSENGVIHYRECDNGCGELDGGTYYVGVTSTQSGTYTGATATYTAGEEFPAVVNDGDVYVLGDFEYRYNYSYDKFGTWEFVSSQNGWGVRALDGFNTSQGDVLDTVNGKPITSLQSTYYLRELEKVPELPATVTNMESTFEDCRGLTNLSGLEIPSGVTSLKDTFNGFDDLTDLSSFTIPSNVTSLEQAFSDCDGLTDLSSFTIPENVTNLKSTFSGCDNLTIAPDVPNSVENMEDTFYNCKALTTAPYLGDCSKLTNVDDCFRDCGNLVTYKGSATNDFTGFFVPGSVSEMDGMFKNCVLLTGTITFDPSSCPESTFPFAGTVLPICVINHLGNYDNMFAWWEQYYDNVIWLNNPRAS